MRLAAVLTALLPAALPALPAQADQLQDDADALEACMVTACRLDLTARRVVDFRARLVNGWVK